MYIIISDGVLNPSGVRFGSGEIYTVLEKFSSNIDDSICVGQRRPNIDKDERVLLFLKMRPGSKFTPSLEKQIRSSIRSALSARHVPQYIFEVEDIPVRLFDHTPYTLVYRLALAHSLTSLPVHCQWKEDRDCGKANCFGVCSETQRDCGEPRVFAVVLQVQRY